MNHAPTQQRDITAPISIGELIDKISILEIKRERIADGAKLRHVDAELTLLRETKSAAGLDTADMQSFAAELKAINTRLWDIEDEIRELEARQDFGERFVTLARDVYLTNDRRADLKKQISLRFGSGIVEEKSYGGR
jgi:Family of unknown function (DUF6165)